MRGSFFKMSRKNVKLSGVCAPKFALQRKNRLSTPDTFGISRDILHFRLAHWHGRRSTNPCGQWRFNFSTKVLSNIVQNTHFDTKLRLQITQNCVACPLVNHVNKRTTCGNEKCCRPRRIGLVFKRGLPRVKVGFVYNFSQENAGKVFEG